MWEVGKKDWEILRELKLDDNPFRAVDEYSPLMSELRWELPEQQELYKSYTKKREVIENEDVDNYYKQKVKPIDKEKWKYLLARKAWHVMPLGWDNIALNGGKVIDIGTGDGDVVQRLIDYVNKFWKEKNISDNTIVVFFSDNGGVEWYNFSDNGFLRGIKGDFFEGGIRVPFTMQWPNQIKQEQNIINQLLL